MSGMQDDASKIYKIGIARVSLGLLEQMLHLPEGHTIKAVRPAAESADLYFEILLEGPTLPESSLFEATPRVRIEITQHEGEPQPSRTFTTEIKAEPAPGPAPDWLRKARAA